jgi:FixJ family two-component response regulator
MKTAFANETRQSLISIVDDEACVRESLSSLIRSMGYRAEDYSSAESFLMDGKWDETACLILDVRLGGMGGLELQRRLAELGREHPPIVIISGHATEKEQAWATRAGAVAFLRKPFSDEALLNAVRACIARARLPIKPAEPKAAQTAQVTPVILFSFMGSPNEWAAGIPEKV